MRLFFALNFSGETKAKLAGLRERLREQASRGNFSRDDNLHLTLVFLGECDARRISAAKAALDGLPFSPLRLTVDRVGRFRREGGDIWWAGLAGSRELSALRGGLARRLADAGFAPEGRGYSPHITLGREVVSDVSPWAIEPFSEEVRSVELMKSERLRGVLTYTAIHKKGAD